MNQVGQALTGATSGRVTWTVGEDEVLRRLYPRASWTELFAALQGRSRVAVQKRAFNLGVGREVKEDPPGHRERLSTRLRERPARLGTGNAHEVRDGVDGKRCTTCDEWRPIDWFARHESCAGGRRNVCRVCDTERSVAWKRAHPDLAVESARRWQRSHPEEYKVIKRAASRRRHGRMVDGRVSAKELRMRHAEFGGRCGYCVTARADTDDHMTPLSRGGRHEIANIIPACRACNFRKHTKTLLEVLLQGM